jgi:hypothetical protein
MMASSFDPSEVHRGRQSAAAPGILVAVLPLVVVVLVNLVMSMLVLLPIALTPSSASFAVGYV